MSCHRAKIDVTGAVQGVGFRPFIYRLATELDLKGLVRNSPRGVAIEVEGEQDVLDQFLCRLKNEKPPRALIQNVECAYDQAISPSNFEIQLSESRGKKSGIIQPDMATCRDCLRELFDPLDRRYRYPFINCTNCGPRFTIIEALPYDRPNTSMKRFAMCPDCEREYFDPASRRFHAQPNACAKCGPRLELWDKRGTTLASEDSALTQAAEAIRSGRIVAAKGIGGFQLLADARNEDAVKLLRIRKRRPEKAFAIMFPSITGLKNSVALSPLEMKLLSSAEAPIVLLKAKIGAREIAPSTAPGNPDLGVMLPYSPLHYLLLNHLGFPIVATSGNVTDEPLCIDEREALVRLGEIADIFLVHDRPIVRPMDDSVMRVVLGRELMLRRARGYAPLPVRLPEPIPAILALGGQLKNTVAMNVGSQLMISQHLGDLETEASYLAFREMVADLPRLYESEPTIIACDMHPDYLSSNHARSLSAPVLAVQHHYAHVLSCMGENGLNAPALGVCWDGTGYGTDGTIWGGEFLSITDSGWERVAHFRQFKLPGGNAAIKQVRRCGLAVLYELFGKELFDTNGAIYKKIPTPFLRQFSSAEFSLLSSMLGNSTNAALTSSAGRLFDAVASLIGVRYEATFEGQAAMELEFAIQPGVEEVYEFQITDTLPHVLDWEPLIREKWMKQKPNARTVCSKR